jgi:hypothetical protein
VTGPRPDKRRRRTGRLTTAAFVGIAFGSAAVLAGLVPHWQLGGADTLGSADARTLWKARLMMAAGGVGVVGGLGLAVLRLVIGPSKNGRRAVVFGVVALVVLGVVCLLTLN